ncbi:MAG: alpha/beta hydrolase [Desulfobulbaceae bacterium]|nr:alpha/beta hydrolase [Desulfobulbaceae bacterium]
MAYLVLCAWLFFFQRSLIYFPQPGSPSNSTSVLTLPTTEAKVLVSVRPQPGPDALIYFGGNAEDTSQSLPGLSAAFPNHALYLLHYRGYGGSSGSPSEEALFQDGMTLFDQVQAHHQRIILFGRSLGTGIAIRVASLRPASRLVLVTPYDSLQDLASSHYPYIPVRWLLRDKYESWRYAPQVQAPTLILVAEHDEVIPWTSTQRLITRFREGLASLQVIAGTSHNTIDESPRYLEALKALPESKR